MNINIDNDYPLLVDDSIDDFEEAFGNPLLSSERSQEETEENHSEREENEIERTVSEIGASRRERDEEESVGEVLDDVSSHDESGNSSCSSMSDNEVQNLKRKRRSIKLFRKIKAIKLVEKGETISGVAKKCNVTRGTAQGWIKKNYWK
jgi:hypothetical protein